MRCLVRLFWRWLKKEVIRAKFNLRRTALCSGFRLCLQEGDRQALYWRQLSEASGHGNTHEVRGEESDTIGEKVVFGIMLGLSIVGVVWMLLVLLRWL